MQSFHYEASLRHCCVVINRGIKSVLLKGSIGYFIQWSQEARGFLWNTTI